MTKVLYWLRQDLRLHDNPALTHAAKQGTVTPVFILDESTRPLGGASKWWLHHSLQALQKHLPDLTFLQGNATEIIPTLAADFDCVVWNRCYEPAAIERDKKIKKLLQNQNINVETFNGTLLQEPWHMHTQQGTPYKVYTPFWRALQQADITDPVEAPQYTTSKGDGIALEALKLCPTNPNWAAGWQDHWQPGEQGAWQRLEEFLAKGLIGYGEQRNRPDLAHTSRLSAHLHWGEISPHALWHYVKQYAEHEEAARADADKFLSELAWREFSQHLLYHFPTLPTENWRTQFDDFPWQQDATALQRWQQGQTGYPIVDAGMRELWQTGTMHNRVRMIVASFLIKHLLTHWREGEQWFWDTLVDADLANNSASWQWVAGCGADASPYFRIFNPITQGEKFDPDGTYTRQWVPELKNLPIKYLFKPWEAPADVLKQAHITLGKTYPQPLIDHTKARTRALEAFKQIKQ